MARVTRSAGYIPLLRSNSQSKGRSRENPLRGFVFPISWSAAPRCSSPGIHGLPWPDLTAHWSPQSAEGKTLCLGNGSLFERNVPEKAHVMSIAHDVCIRRASGPQLYLWSTRISPSLVGYDVFPVPLNSVLPSLRFLGAIQFPQFTTKMVYENSNYRSPVALDYNEISQRNHNYTVQSIH